MNPIYKPNFGAVFCQISIKIPPELKKEAKEHKLNLSAICRKAIRVEIQKCEDMRKC